MTAAVALSEVIDTFAELRANEFAHLRARGLIYLDYTGSAIAAESQIRAHDALLRDCVLGNPHSEHVPSRTSTAFIEEARERLLGFLGAWPDEYEVIFTANASGAIKLVAESFPFRRGSRLALAADNHNSMNGVGEFARRKGATVLTVPLTRELRLDDPVRHLTARSLQGPSLFGFPAQSNFSGVRHSLALVNAAQRLGYRVLLDAAAFVPSSPIRLRETKPDFIALSLYKLFGFPTGIGALVARRDALATLKRPWFAGGTVDWASVQLRTHQLRGGPGAFEDGTPNFYGLAAARAGFDLLARVDMGALSQRMNELARLARTEMQHSTHANNVPMFRIYGPDDAHDQGGTIALNLLDRNGRFVPYETVERRARDMNVAVRGGCFCNPGASEAAFGFERDATRRCLREASREGFSPQRLGACLGPAVAVGAIRLSVGLATSDADVVTGIERLAHVARGFQSE